PDRPQPVAQPLKPVEQPGPALSTGAVLLRQRQLAIKRFAYHAIHQPVASVNMRPAPIGQMVVVMYPPAPGIGVGQLGPVGGGGASSGAEGAAGEMRQFLAQALAVRPAVDTAGRVADQGQLLRQLLDRAALVVRPAVSTTGRVADLRSLLALSL